MRNKTLLTVVETLEKLASKLPGPLQRPILEELTPVKELFLLGRPPRILLLGATEVDETAVINGLFGNEVASMSDVGGHWKNIGQPGRGTLRILDGRSPVPTETVLEELREEPADAVLLCTIAGMPEETLNHVLDRAAAVLKSEPGENKRDPVLIGLQMLAPGEDALASRQKLHGALHARSELSRYVASTVDLPATIRFRHGELEGGAEGRIPFERLAELLAKELPLDSRLEMARLSGIRSVQNEIARTLLKSVTAICSAIGAQPIPLADFPILTALQGIMVAGIIHVSGREWSMRTASRFVGALGANVGAGLVFRETARAAAKLLPGWGNAISGGIAGLGTYAIGKAAIAYFIEGASMEDAKKLWSKVRRRKKGAPVPEEPPKLKDSD